MDWEVQLLSLDGSIGFFRQRNKTFDVDDEYVRQCAERHTFVNRRSVNSLYLSRRQERLYCLLHRPSDNLSFNNFRLNLDKHGRVKLALNQLALAQPLLSNESEQIRDHRVVLSTQHRVHLLPALSLGNILSVHVVRGNHRVFFQVLQQELSELQGVSFLSMTHFWFPLAEDFNYVFKFGFSDLRSQL